MINKNNLFNIFPITFMILGIMLLVMACGKKNDAPKINLSHEVPVSEGGFYANSEEPLKVAVSAMISSKESIIYYEDLLKVLGEQLNRPIEVIQRKTYSEVNDLLRVNKVDFAFICTYAYILGKREFGLDLLVAPMVNGETTYQNYMIVHKDSGITSFEDLKMKRFAFTDPLSFTGRLYAINKLQEMGYTPEEFFSETIYTYSHDNSIKAVAQGLVDGASIDGLILEYLYTIEPEFYGNVRIIHKSEGFGMPPVVFPPGGDTELKKELQNIFLSMHLNREHKTILDKLLIDQFFIPQPQNYATIEKIADKVLVP